MKKRKALELVKALRSGKYKQGHQLLKRQLPDGTCEHCVLGVACELSPLVKWIPGEIKSPSLNIMTCALPALVMQEFGFGHLLGARRDGQEIEIDGQFYHHLASASDCGVPFPKIADYIEQNYKYL